MNNGLISQVALLEAGGESDYILGFTLPSLILLGAGGGILLTIAIMGLMKKGNENLFKILVLICGVAIAATPILPLVGWGQFESNLWLSPNLVAGFGLFGPFIAGGVAIMTFVLYDKR